MAERNLTYRDAIREGLTQILGCDERVFVIGQGVWSPWYVGGSMTGLDLEFGRSRIVDTPVSENGVTGIALGAALVGMRPIVVHPRMDFILLAFDQLVNQAANWRYMYGGRSRAPIVIRPIINRGGSQASQLSQALHAMLMHVPGLKVVMPSTPYDAKGLLMASVADDDPVVYIDDRWLYEERGHVPRDRYSVPIGRAAIRRTGHDVTVVSISFMMAEVMTAVELLAARNVSAEAIDLRTLFPLDQDLLYSSVEKTGRVVVVDGGWKTCGIAAEIAAKISEDMFFHLRAPIARVTLPDCPAPMSQALEESYYPKAADIVAVVDRVMSVSRHESRGPKAV